MAWVLDGNKPVVGPRHLARAILRFFKGHGRSYQLDEVGAVLRDEARWCL